MHREEQLEEGQLKEEQLIEQMRNGDEQAMEALIRIYYADVLAYLYRQLGDYHTACDLTQETWIKMIRKLDTYTASGKFRHWLLRIALNVCRDHIKSRMFRNQQQTVEWLEWQEQRHHAHADVPHTLADVLETREEQQTVQEAVLALPDYQRETIVLRYFHDMKIRDIAAATQVGEPTVKSRLKQGIAKLRMKVERSARRDEQTGPL